MGEHSTYKERQKITHKIGDGLLELLVTPSCKHVKVAKFLQKREILREAPATHNTGEMFSNIMKEALNYHQESRFSLLISIFGSIRQLERRRLYTQTRILSVILSADRV